MLEKIMVLHEIKLMGIDISAKLEKMYEKYGKEEFQHAAKVSGYGFILQQFPSSASPVKPAQVHDLEADFQIKIKRRDAAI